MKLNELTLNDWQDAINQVKALAKPPAFVNDGKGLAMRIENTMFTSARYYGGMTYNSEKWTYFEPIVEGEEPNPDGTPYVAWLMVRDEFAKWVSKNFKKGANK